MVIAIISIVAAFTTMSIRGVQQSYQLAKTATQVKDSLHLARQMATTRNESIFVSFCKVKDEFGNEERINALQLSRLSTNGTMVPVSKLIRFPSGFSISEDPNWSSIVRLLPEVNIAIQSASVRGRQIGFRPSGFTSMASSNAWYLTLMNSQGSTASADNFVTLLIDPVTGRVSWNQP